MIFQQIFIDGLGTVASIQYSTDKASESSRLVLTSAGTGPVILGRKSISETLRMTSERAEVMADGHHIATLVCDTPIDGIADKYGDFGDNVEELLKKHASCETAIVKYQVAFEDGEQYTDKLEETYRMLEERIVQGKVLGVVLTGSRSNSFDIGVAWIDKLDQFLKNVLFRQKNFPIVGLCFGHQIICKNLGSKVGRNLPQFGWEYGTTTINLNKEILAVNSPFYEVLRDENGNVSERINLVEFHQDIVQQTPPPSTMEKWKTSFHSIGSTPKCAIQGIMSERGPLKILTFQGHPEFPTSMTLDMFERGLRRGTIDKKDFDKSSYNTQNLNNQGPEIGKVIHNFLLKSDTV